MPQDRQPCVYILASGRHGTLYIGVTSNLPARLHRHREGLIEGFTSRYGVHRLAYFELFDDMPTAITREKQLKKWRRMWKIGLIEESNPDWGGACDRVGLRPVAVDRSAYGSPRPQG